MRNIRHFHPDDFHRQLDPVGARQRIHSAFQLQSTPGRDSNPVRLEASAPSQTPFPIRRISWDSGRSAQHNCRNPKQSEQAETQHFVAVVTVVVVVCFPLSPTGNGPHSTSTKLRCGVRILTDVSTCLAGSFERKRPEKRKKKTLLVKISQFSWPRPSGPFPPIPPFQSNWLLEPDPMNPIRQ